MPNVNQENVPPDLKEALEKLLQECRHLWSGELGKMDATLHRIQLKPDAMPAHLQPYRAGPHRRDEIEKQVNKMLKVDVFEPSDGDWAFPVVVVPKPGGHLLFCVEFKRLNEMAVKDVYPIPRMDDSFHFLGDATLISTLDSNAGYWQIPPADEDKDKTTFTCHMVLFRCKRLPFGLTSAPAIFQRAIDIILSGLR
eukprot:contig_5117_g1132